MAISTSCIIRRLFLLLSAALLTQTAMSRVFISVNGKEIDAQELNMKWAFDTSRHHNYKQWLDIQSKLQDVGDGDIAMSYKAGMFWISLDLEQLPIQDSTVYLELRNPHINYLGAWLLNGNNLVKAFPLTGDHLPFNTRDIHHSQFVYKLNLHNRQNLRLVLMIDKRNEQLHLPLNFFTDKTFIDYQRDNSLMAGLFVGISVFILLFTIFLYFNIREPLYIYYALYVLMVGGYIFSDLGLSFMYFYPGLPSIADYARPFTISQAPIYYILFSRSLLRVKENFPGLFRFTNWYLGFFIFCFILGFGIPSDGALRTFWLVFMQVLMITSIIPVFLYSIAGWRKGVRYSSYIVLASVMFTLFSQIYMQYITGNLPDNAFSRNAVNIGFSIEIILLTLALSIRFKNYKLEADELLRRMNLQQENIFRNISEYQEKEMKRLSGFLHDSVGAGLSSIKFNLETIENQPQKQVPLLKTTIEDVSNLTDEIRNISHSLSPLLLQKKGLITGLHHLITRYNRTGKVKIWLESIGSLSSSSFQNELMVFRMVQELLQNAIKHAHASEIIIQLIIEPGIISVLVEDNGRGFDKNSIKDGLGFSQIKALVTFVNGRFEVHSMVNKGCSVSIEFPTMTNESTDKSTTGRRSPYVY